jgi:hypothetical protein
VHSLLLGLAQMENENGGGIGNAAPGSDRAQVGHHKTLKSLLVVTDLLHEGNTAREGAPSVAFLLQC